MRQICFSVQTDPVYSDKIILRTYGKPSWGLWRTLFDAGISCTMHPFRSHASHVLNRKDAQRAVAVLRLNGFEVMDDDAPLNIFTPEA